MPDITPTADLYDEHGERLDSCDTQFRQFGGRDRFAGTVTTVRCFEDNALIREVLSEPGHGKVLVVDGGGSTHCALMGDQIAELAVRNGWEGAIIHGVIRDAVMLGQLDLGVKALGTNPRKSSKQRTGDRDVTVAFGGAVFPPGAQVVSDEDGVVVLAAS